jgi:inhibitor of cysteine peptidase
MNGQRDDDQDHVLTTQSIEANVGDELDIVLPDIPGSGYEWAVRKVPDGLPFVSTEWAEPLPAEVGASRARTFRFAARRPGEYDVGFDLVRPWESPDVAPVRQHTASVTVRDL